MKYSQISNKIKSRQGLVLKLFQEIWNQNLINQVLRKLVKLHNSQNVNQLDYINVYGHSRNISWMSFLLWVIFEKWCEVKIFSFMSHRKQNSLTNQIHLLFDFKKVCFSWKKVILFSKVINIFLKMCWFFFGKVL